MNSSPSPRTADPPRPGPRASLQGLCPRCEEMFLYPVGAAPGKALECPHCHLTFQQSGEPEDPEAPVESCWVCGNEEFYEQKDFNRELGFMIVLISGLLVFLLMLLVNALVGILCLLGIALLDWVVYRMLTDVTVCYLCQSIYRGFPPSPRKRNFYLGYEEKYKTLRQSWLKQVLPEPEKKA